ncbi:hypothetical protein KP509_07G054200 [Ceratopteris richardii]|uniref:Uncharacterized protein n=1 Tax=Ceratopteris richardii TaxID=49495 RepID=A0A8T2UEJ0_CERRI|nr:hypothetical protein KP509_07G054200 [Ceratopteris richardii]
MVDRETRGGAEVMAKGGGRVGRVSYGGGVRGRRRRGEGAEAEAEGLGRWRRPAGGRVRGEGAEVRDREIERGEERGGGEGVRCGVGRVSYGGGVRGQSRRRRCEGAEAEGLGRWRRPAGGRVRGEGAEAEG